MPLNRIKKWFHSTAEQKFKRRIDGIYEQNEFLSSLKRERAKAERSHHQFSLVVFETGVGKLREAIVFHLSGELRARMRATDMAGWIKHNQIGTILHDASTAQAQSFARNIQLSLLSGGIELPCSVYSFPSMQKNGTETDVEAQGYQDHETHDQENQVEHKFGGNVYAAKLHHFPTKKMTQKKRLFDLLGSAIGLILLSPVLLLIWFLIKIVSPGSAIYKQTRIGLGGRPFTFFKFRTMEINADTSEHRKYLSSLIKDGRSKQKGSKAMIKLDERNENIIPLGKFLRKTYLDELPQLVNVLLGDMSLIGPRPPIPYEVAEYDLWHTGRFDTTPGMTGLWQVSGKNRLSFDQMVRLDIKYIRTQTFLTDLKILFLTPVVIAYEVKDSLSKFGLHLVDTEEIKL